MKIIFKKILDYDLKKDTQDGFFYICDILSQEVDPDSIKTNELIPKTSIVFSSKLARAVQCIKKDNKFKLIKKASLNEIPFKLKFYCDENMYKKEGSTAVRKIFKRMFVEDSLMITRKKIFKEIQDLLLYIKNTYSFEKKVTIVSHSFRLKCIEAYLKTNGQIIENPKLIHMYIKDDKKTFGFGKGFVVEA